jgi:hypothetical protein
VSSEHILTRVLLSTIDPSTAEVELKYTFKLLSDHTAAATAAAASSLGDTDTLIAPDNAYNCDVSVETIVIYHNL